MADSFFGQMYSICEEKSRAIWSAAKSDLIKCFAYYFHSILAVTKCYFGPVYLTSGSGSNNEKLYREAIRLISDPITDELVKRKAINWTRSNKPVTALIVPRELPLFAEDMANPEAARTDVPTQRRLVQMCQPRGGSYRCANPEAARIDVLHPQNNQRTKDSDGNSLCHSLAVLVFGVPDQRLVLRRYLNQTCEMHREEKSPLYDRWSRVMKNLCEEFGRDYNIVSLLEEWKRICDASSLAPTSDAPNTKFSPLQQFHIFVMSQVLRRIIVVASVEEGGFKPSVYLPLLIPVDKCIKAPLYICYRQGHFAPLVFVDEIGADKRFGDLCFPIVDHQFQLYDFPYLLDNEDPLIMLDKYARRTTIGFTTVDDFKELPALRVPSHEYRTVSGCDVTGPDPSDVLMTCFEGLEHHRNPDDTCNLWKGVLELQGKFHEELVASSYARSEGASHQPEYEAEDQADGGKDGAEFLHEPDLSYFDHDYVAFYQSSVGQDWRTTDSSIEGDIYPENPPVWYNISNFNQPQTARSEPEHRVEEASAWPHNSKSAFPPSTAQNKTQPSNPKELFAEGNARLPPGSRSLQVSEPPFYDNSCLQPTSFPQRQQSNYSSNHGSSSMKSTHGAWFQRFSSTRNLDASFDVALNPVNNQSEELIHRSSADHSLGSVDRQQVLYSIEGPHYGLDASMEQAGDGGSAITTGGMASSRVETSAGAARFTDIKDVATSSKALAARHEGTSQDISTKYRSILGEYTVKQSRKDRVSISEPQSIILYTSALEAGGKKVLYQLSKSSLETEGPVKLSFEKRNDVSINYSLTNHSVLTMMLRQTPSGLTLDVKRPSSMEIDKSSSPIDGAEELVYLDVEHDSPHFDFRQNDLKCRTAGCLGRALRQNRNLCGSCYESWREMLSREDSSIFSYFDSVTSIGSRVSEDSCKNRNCRGKGEEKYFGFCEKCFHSSSVEW